MAIWWLVSLLAIGISIFVFPDRVVITYASAGVLGLAVLSVIQAILFKLWGREKIDHTNEITYATREADHEAEALSMKYHALTKLAVVPLLCLCVFYFGTVWKIVLSCLLYLVSYLPVRFLVKRAKRR